jgi:hypothetical protein
VVRLRTVKNYTENGGDVTVIGDELKIVTGAKITADGDQAVAIANHDDTDTATAAEIAVKQNAILAALRGVGIIASE